MITTAQHNMWPMRLAAVFVVALGLALLPEWVGWQRNLTRVALLTAIGLWVLEAGMVALDWHDEGDRAFTPHWLPISVAAGVASATVGWWQVLIADGRAPFALIPAAALGGGLLMAAVLALTTFLTQRSRAQAAQLQRINHMLAAQIAHRVDAERRTSLALDAGQMGTWELDLATGTLDRSVRHDQIFGYTTLQPDWGTKNLLAAVVPEDIAMARRAVDDALKTGTFNLTCQIRWPDASRHWIAAHGIVDRDARGDPVRILGTVQDATEHRRVEGELKRARDTAEAATRTKNEFLANMSHEIRTPMNGVIGMTELVLDTDLTFDQREYLGMVKSSADALLTIINDILDLSKMEVGRLELDPIDFNLRDAVGDIANTVALRAHQKGLELIVDIEPAVPETVKGDPGRLRQILVNLLGNAIKFTAQGEVVLRVALETGSLDPPLHFSVSDTGIGIALERQQCVFDAFTQADGSVARTYGGTGLGLTISSQLVQLMGGQLLVDSEIGKGSTFHFTASLAEVSSGATAGRAAVDATALRGLRAIIVDDNATNRRLLEEMLLGWHMVPTLAVNAAEALIALRVAEDAGTPFRLVLSDVQMADTDGFTLAEAIKREPHLASATVMMLTSSAAPGDAARCRELGVAAYLTKPIKRSDLRAAIVVAFNGRSPDSVAPGLVTRHSLREARPHRRVLLVEDDSVNQLLARRLLERRGHIVVVASHGREALAILEKVPSEKFDCVLMDVEMPGMDGFACTAVIREWEHTSGCHLPIIAMTAHAMKGDEARCLVAGMDGYLSKPIQPDQLFDAIDRCL